MLALLGVGSLVLWLGIPVGGMWLASKLTDSFGLHMPLALALVLPGMFVMALGLAWLNDLYLRLTGGEIEEVEGLPRHRQGPLEPMLAVCFTVAAVSLIFWFFVLAENPSGRFLG